MKRNSMFVTLLGVSLILGFTRTAHAQRWDWNDEGNAAQFRSFDTFLNEHPNVAKKLWEKPERVNDPGFVNKNKDFKQWLEDHPGAARAFADNPGGFMERERHFRMYGADISEGSGRRGELARFDWFLDGHPDVRRELMHRPELVNRPEYLNHHAELREFLHRHPMLTQELQEHPREFMEREARYEQHAM